MIALVKVDNVIMVVGGIAQKPHSTTRPDVKVLAFTAPQVLLFLMQSHGIIVGEIFMNGLRTYRSRGIRLSGKKRAMLVLP